MQEKGGNLLKNTTYSLAMHKVLVPATVPQDTVSQESLQVLASFIQIAGQNGFLITGELAQALSALNIKQLREVTGDVVAALSNLNLGKQFACMYPGFPKTVMNADRLTLYFGAMLHYLSDGKIRLNIDRELTIHPELVKVKHPTTLHIMKQHEVTQVLRALLQAQTMWTPDQTEWIRYNLSANAVKSAFRAGVTIPHRANAAVVCGQFLSQSFVSSLVTTQTDVLRIAAALFRSDPLLETPGNFPHVSRMYRRRLLERMDAVSQHGCADMRRHERYWKALSSVLHPGEYQTQYPHAFAAFRALWTGTLDPSFASKVERAYQLGKPSSESAEEEEKTKKEKENVGEKASNKAREAVISLLEQRPGEFSRGLFRLLQTFPSLPEQLATLHSYLSLLPQLDTMKLIGMWELVQNNNTAENRVFLPKGGSRAPFVREEPPVKLPPLIQSLLLSHVQSELILRFSQKTPLGKVYIAPEVDKLRIPKGQTATSGALRDMARGSRLSLAPNCHVLRAFVFWKNPTAEERVDVDLSAILYTDDLTAVGCISYFNLKLPFACHSGDIVDAPCGAAEYIDIDLSFLEQKSAIADKTQIINSAGNPIASIRYIAFTAAVFTCQWFSQLSVCSAGWMERADLDSGEIWEPTTVAQQFNLQAATRQETMFLLDIQTREIIWLDRPGSSEFEGLPNNVITRAAAQKAALMTELTGVHMSLGDLLRLHAKARGELVDSPEEADYTIMSGGSIDPYGFSRVIGDWL